MECPNPNCENNDMGMPLETDSRQEWCEETYGCEECGKTFVRRIEYQTQSELVESDTIEEVD